VERNCRIPAAKRLEIAAQGASFGWKWITSKRGARQVLTPTLWSYHIRGHKYRNHREKSQRMCRNIKTLFNFDPPVTQDEVRAASLQFVRKISGFNKPSKANEASFSAAVDEIAGIASRLLRSLETTAPPKNREEEAAKARARAAERFGG
jgi:hypothetical protein